MKLKSIFILSIILLLCNSSIANNISNTNEPDSALLYIIYENNNPIEFSSKFFCDIKVNDKNYVTLLPNKYATIQIPTGYCKVNAHVYMSEIIPEIISETRFFLNVTRYIYRDLFISHNHERGFRADKGQTYYIIIKETDKQYGKENIEYIHDKSDIKEINKKIKKGEFTYALESNFLKDGEINVIAESAIIRTEIISLKKKIEEIDRNHSRDWYISKTDPETIENEQKQKVESEKRIKELEIKLIELEELK